MMLKIRAVRAPKDEMGSRYGVGYVSNEGRWEYLFHTRDLIKACELVSWLNGGECPPLHDIHWLEGVEHG